MTLAGLLNEPVTIHRRTPALTRDIYGNLEEGDTSTFPTVAYLEQQTATEILVDRETYVSDWKGYLLAGTPIAGRDLIVDAAGVTYEVIGLPDTAYNPRTRADSHVVVNLRVVTG